MTTATNSTPSLSDSIAWSVVAGWFAYLWTVIVQTFSFHVSWDHVESAITSGRVLLSFLDLLRPNLPILVLGAVTWWILIERANNYTYSHAAAWGSLILLFKVLDNIMILLSAAIFLPTILLLPLFFLPIAIGLAWLLVAIRRSFVHENQIV